MAWIYLIVGLALLLVGGEGLVRGAVAIAKRHHISPMIIGLTIVSFGTSAPELLVSLQAALDGHPDISIGNVVGSNIANLAMVLGVTALILPIAVAKRTLSIDWPVMMASTLLFWYMISDQIITRTEGVILILCLVAYLYGLYSLSKRESALAREAAAELDIPDAPDKPWVSGLFILLGCLGLVAGAQLLVNGATDIARDFGVSERVIGVTIVAFGTSVPELATSVIAAMRKELDISVGNLIGSNIFNILAILGITAAVTPIPVDVLVGQSDIFWVLGITLLVFAFSRHKWVIHRWKGLLLFAFYVAYIYIVLI